MSTREPACLGRRTHCLRATLPWRSRPGSSPCVIVNTSSCCAFSLYLSLSFLLSLDHILQRSHVFQPPLLKNLYWAPSIFPAYFYAQKVFCILSKEIFLPLVIPILYSPLNSPRCPVMRMSSSLDYRQWSHTIALCAHCAVRLLCIRYRVII